MFTLRVFFFFSLSLSLLLFFSISLSLSLCTLGSLFLTLPLSVSLYLSRTHFLSPFCLSPPLHPPPFSFLQPQIRLGHDG